MKKLISIVCPTHKRPKLQKRFARYVHDNCYDSKYSEIIFGIDNNDQLALQAAEELKQEYGDNFIRTCLVEPDQEKIASIVNSCASIARAQIVGNAADDVVFKSKNWDITVLKEFEKSEDKIILLWGDDGLWDAALASHYFLHKNWIKTVGHMQPTHFYADWTDHWMQRLAKRLGRAVVIHDRERLFLEHLHAEFDGMEKDETYYKVKKMRERNKTEGIDIDSPELRNLHNEEYEKLASFIKNFKIKE